MRKIIYLVLGIISIMVLSSSRLWASAHRAAESTPVATPDEAADLGWPYDDRYLFFTEEPGRTNVDTPKQWKVYDTQTQTITTRTGFPLLPILSDQERLAFAPAPKTFYFSSPDNSLLAFFKGSGNHNWTLWLGDRTTRQMFNTGIVIWDATDLIRVQVEWSKDSSAFAIRHASEDQAPSIDYITGYKQGFSTVTVKPNIIQVQIPDQQLVDTTNLFGLSGDGTKVLVSADRPVGSDKTYKAYLVLYDPINPANGKVLQGFDLGAGDLEADARLVDWQTSQVIINSREGIFRYDIATDTVIQMNPFFYRGSPLSHDGRKIALFDDQKGLFIFSVSELDFLATKTPTPTNTPTMTPALSR